MKATRIPLYILLALLLTACGDKKAAEPDKGGVKSSVTNETPALLVPDALKHAGYEYQGLGNFELLTYDVTFENMPTQDGTQQFKLDKVEEGVATYTVSRTGGLARLGVETVELDSKGVRIASSSMGVLKEPSQVMLADASVGTTWETRLDMDNVQGSTQNVTTKIVNKVAGNETITVPAGTFECLVVETAMESTSSGSPVPSENKKSNMKMTTYYAKGVGVIKLLILDKGKETGRVELKARGSEENSGVSSDSADKSKGQ